MLDLAIIIVSWNVRDYLAECLSSVYEELYRTGLQGQVWVVDNASTDGTINLVNGLFSQTHLISNKHNCGFGAANNQGMWAAAKYSPRYYLLLNPDTFIRPGALGQLVNHLDNNPQVGVAGPRLIYGDGQHQHSAFHFPGLWQLLFDLWPMPPRLYDSRLNGRYSLRLYRAKGVPFPVDHTLGAAMLVRSDVAEKTKGFDESFHMYCEEIDWCMRIRKAGWDIHTVPAAEIVHYGGQSAKQIPAPSVINLWRSRAQFYAKHYGRIRLALARRLAYAGLMRKALEIDNPNLRQAYKQVAREWKPSRSLRGRIVPSRLHKLTPPVLGIQKKNETHGDNPHV